MRVFHSLCSRKRQEPQRCTSNAALQNYNMHGFGMEESAQKSLSYTSHTITIRLTEELASIAGRRTAKPSFLPHLEMGEPRFSGRDSTKTLTKLWCAALKATGLPGWVSLPMIRPCPYATLDPRMCTRLTGRQCSCKFRLFDLAAFPFPCLAGLEDLRVEHRTLRYNSTHSPTSLSLRLARFPGTPPPGRHLPRGGRKNQISRCRPSGAGRFFLAPSYPSPSLPRTAQLNDLTTLTINNLAVGDALASRRLQVRDPAPL